MPEACANAAIEQAMCFSEWARGPRGLCVVLSGRVRTVITSTEGREQALKMFGPGRTFADIAVFDDEPQPAEAVAVSESTVVLIPQADLLDLLRRHPEVGIEVMRLFASRLRAYNRWYVTAGDLGSS